MTRITPFTSPLLLGFDAMEKTLERIAKGNDGYPPYNIERVRRDDTSGEPDSLRITLAVAGFSEDELDVTTEENQLIIRGRQTETGNETICTGALRRASSSGCSYLPRECRFPRRS